MSPAIIQIDREESWFVLTGDTNRILSNKRLYFSFRRLHVEVRENALLIPYEMETAIATLQEIQAILEKFDASGALSLSLREEAESYHREQEYFQQFAEAARDIRDAQFEARPELVKDFDLFQTIVRKSLVRTLYPLQLLSAYHMAFAQNACNFAVPGAGKTTIVYAAFSYLKSLPASHVKHVDKLLIVGPLSSFKPWEDEYRECFGHPTSIRRLSGDPTMLKAEKREHLFSGDPAEITLIFHGGVARLEAEMVSFLKRNKTMVVIDEAHRIKNPEGVWGRSAIAIGKEARSRVILTGTPVPNGYEDLFNLYQFLYPYKYRDILGFHYGNLIEMSEAEEFDTERVKELVRNVSPYFIRIKKADLGLPPIVEKSILVNMDPAQREIYDFIESRYMKSFSQNGAAGIRDLLNRARLIRLRQAATDPSLLLRAIQETIENDDYESSLGLAALPEEYQEDSEIIAKITAYKNRSTPTKFSVVEQLVSKNLQEDKKTLIWTIFIQNAKQLQAHLAQAGIEAELLIGEVKQSDREQIVTKFNDPSHRDFRVVIANPFSVAESISLHRGCHCAVYLERDYNCSNFVQSKDRIHRVGLAPDQLTEYYYILARDSIDEVIHQRLELKVRRMEKIIDDDIPLFTRLNDADETDLVAALMDAYAKRAQLL